MGFELLKRCQDVLLYEILAEEGFEKFLMRFEVAFDKENRSIESNTGP